MTNKRPSLLARWMISPREVLVMAAVAAFAVTALFLSIKDAIQLAQTLNLNLTQTLIVSQGIVNLQREVQITHQEVERLLGHLDNPPKPLSRFSFLEIQVSNLSLEAQSPSKEYTFTDEAIAGVQEIVAQTANIKTLISSLQEGDLRDQETVARHEVVLRQLDTQLGDLEVSVKQLVDFQSTAQRNAIVQTRDSLSASQGTTFMAGGVLLLLSVALAFVFRQSLSTRLQRAVEADQLKSQLLANVSHELRTPITAIQGYSQLLDDGTYGELSEKQKNTIQRILINTTQLKGMVNNLLDSAQIEQGKLGLRNAPFAPRELIESTRSALNILAMNKGLRLTSEIAIDVPPSLTGDLLRLQQILFNLISNAIKFTQSGSIHTRVFLPDHAHWALQVADTGMGISSENQLQVFTAFWQIDSSATREYRGTGLGLSIVKQLVNLMGGTIKLESELGKGSKFTVIFPLETTA